MRPPLALQPEHKNCPPPPPIRVLCHGPAPRSTAAVSAAVLGMGRLPVLSDAARLRRNAQVVTRLVSWMDGWTVVGSRWLDSDSIDRASGLHQPLHLNCPAYHQLAVTGLSGATCAEAVHDLEQLPPEGDRACRRSIISTKFCPDLPFNGTSCMF